MHKKILVTGSTGFIGEHLIQELERRGIEYCRFQGDILNEVQNWDIVKNEKYSDITHCIHLAAKTYVPDSWKNASSFYQVNCMGTVHALEFCRISGAKLVYLSSCVYAQSDEPINEEFEISTKDPYSHSKRIGEELCSFYNEEMGVAAIILRLFNIYGEGQRKEFLISKLVEQALNSSDFEVANLSPRRDYVYIDDLVDAIIASIDSDIGYGIYNIGTGISYSVDEVINLLCELTGKEKQVVDLRITRPNERYNVVADVSRIKKDLGWEPKTSLREGLRLMVKGKDL